MSLRQTINCCGKTDDAKIPKPGDLHEAAFIDGVSIRESEEQRIRAVTFLSQPFLLLSGRYVSPF